MVQHPLKRTPMQHTAHQTEHPTPLATSDGVVALSPAMMIMSTNHVIRWIIGHEPKPGNAFPLERLFLEPDHTRVRAALNHTLETGQPGVGMEAELHSDSGAVFLCGYSIHPIFDNRQMVIGVILTFHKNPSPVDRDTARNASRRNRQTMRHTPPATHTLIDELPEGVFTITIHWRISSFNRAAEQITGYKREEVIGKYCWETFQSNKCKTSCPLRRALDSGQSSIDQEVRMVNKTGSRRAMLVNTNVLRDRTGLVLGAVETFRPLTGEIHPPEGVEIQHSFADIVGQSENMRRLFKMIPDVAASEANVLIYGESGTGKDLFARAIHSHSLRSKGPFVAVNCSAFAESLLESELFGHEKSAFTGADRSKPGRFEMARGGTLFLDEIGELRPELQVKLLRVLEQREFERVGGTRSLPMDARIISATNRNLVDAIKSARFREDFYYRLRTVPLTLPPLRERKEDIPLLVNHFIKRFNKKYNKKVRSVDVKVMRFFETYDFPGNVREMERAVEHAYVFVKGPVIFMSNLPSQEEFNAGREQQEERYNTGNNGLTRESIAQALSLSRGRRQQAANLLGISRTSLWRHMKKYGLN